MASYYDLNAQEVTAQYLSKTFEQVHNSWLHLLPSILKRSNLRILDVGGASGRDVKYLAEKILITQPESQTSEVQIYAVEPSLELTKWGQQTTKNLSIEWLQDSLPALDYTTKLDVSFDLILLSAVWMHIPPNARFQAFRALTNLLKPGGQLVISLRYGHTEDERTSRNMFDVSADELKQLANEHGLLVKLETDLDKDQLGRGHVTWQTVVLEK